jgi:hypothetical protein
MVTLSGLDILTIVEPNNSRLFNINDHVRNRNAVLLVIDSMCLGMLLPYHIARRFSYIVNAIEYDEYVEIEEGGLKMINIDKNWDTKKWSYSKIKKFYNILEYIELYDTDKIKEKICNFEYNYEIRMSIDFHFLESLLWNSNLELD